MNLAKERGRTLMDCTDCMFYDELFDPDTNDEIIWCSAENDADKPDDCPERQVKANEF